MAEGFDRALRLASVAGLAVLVGVIGFALLYRSRLGFQINYNEGWNSFFTGRVLQGLPLYPDRSTRLINNYPPLSFYMTALVAKLTGSVLVAGRALAWCGYAGCAAVIGLVLRRMGADVTGALIGALFFAAALAVRCDLYVGMFDPQLFAQLVMLAGFLTLVSRPDRAGAVVAAALMVVGGFMKHSLIALPVSVTIWLALYRREILVAWLVAGVVCASAGLAASLAAYGPAFIAGLALPRQTSLASALAKMLRWLLPLELPCVLATLPALLGRGREPNGMFVLIYLAVAFATGIAGAAPLGTNYNMIFELLVAVSLGLGLLVGTWSPRVPAGWVGLAACASLYVTAMQLGTAETSSWRVWSAAQRARDAEARSEIAFIRATPGEALCGTLLFCFEAGKAMIYDPLNYGAAPGERQADLQRDIAAHRFGVVQLDEASQYLNNETIAALKNAYKPEKSKLTLFTPN